MTGFDGANAPNPCGFDSRAQEQNPAAARIKRADDGRVLVGLAGFEDFYPSELSGGMQKRAGLARAMALDPDVLFFDEPSAGLDPVSARRLDDLIIELRESLGTTIVVVTHELASIFTIATDAIYLDNRSLTLTAHGHPAKILQETTDESIITFLTRGEGRKDAK